MAKNSIQTFASALAKKHKITIAAATDFVNAVFDIVTEELKNNNQVKIKGLGTFKVLKVKPRESVNVNTGERVLIEGHDKISFTPDAAMKELVNKPFSQFETVVLNEGVNFDDEEVNEIETVDEPEVKESHQAISADIKEPTRLQDIDAIGAQKESEPINETTMETADLKEETVEELTRKPEEETSEVDNSAEQQYVNSSEEVSEVEKLSAEPEGAETERVDSDNTSKELFGSDNELQEDNVAEKVSELTEKIIEEKVDKSTEKPEEKLAEKPVTSLYSDKEEVIEDNKNKSSVEKQEDSLHVVFDDDDEISSEDRTLWLMLKVIGIVLLLIIIFFVGRAFISNDKTSRRQPQISKVEEASQKPASKPKAATIKTTVPKPIPEADSTNKQAEKGLNEFIKLSNDPRIRYGAYNIIGIEKIVVLKKGQTMSSYSRKALGPGMVGYFQVLNGKSEMGPGDTLKVPKVEYRPQYQNRK